MGIHMHLSPKSFAASPSLDVIKKIEQFEFKLQTQIT